MKKKIFIVAAVIVGSQLQAQEDSTGRVLDEVVITSNKYPKKQSETGKVITVINRQQLEKSSGKTLGELLNTVAGTTILGANNNLGTNLTGSIRGASAGNILILVDGIPVNDASVNNNYFDLNFFSIDQVERIEILKGGQSTLYGSDAVLGVINIISKKPESGAANISGSLSGGSYSTFKQNLGINGKSKNLDYIVSYSHLKSNGFSSAYDQTKTGDFDKDGIDQHIANARLNFNLTKKMQLNAFGTYSYYNTDLDAFAYTDEKDYSVKNDNAQVGAGFTYLHNKGSLKFNYHFNYVEREYTDDSAYQSPFLVYSKTRFIGRTHFAEVYNDWKWNDWELLVGLDSRFNNTYQYSWYIYPGFPTTPSSWKANMSQVSPYTSFVYKTGKGFTTELGGRLNIHSEYGSNFTFNLNPSYLVNNKVKLFVNLYSAFKTPTLYQLFDPSAGNKDLNPEKGLIGEAGAEIFSKSGFKVRAVGFYRHTKDAIVYTYDPSTFAAKYFNVSEQDNYGAELEASYTGNKWNISVNYAYTDGKITSTYDGTGVELGKDTTYHNIYRIPKNAINVNIGWQATKALYISTQLRSVGERSEFIFGAAPQTLKPYATIDLYGEYRFNKNIKVFADLKNIANKEYFDFPGYNSRRFNFMAGVNFNL